MKNNKTIDAFRNAFAGLAYFFKHERNGRLQLLIGIIIILLSIFLHVSLTEWLVIIICIGAVLSAEMMNSVLEKICNYVQPLVDPRIKIIKDVAAGAVLFICIAASIIGAIIFIPKICQLL